MSNIQINKVRNKIIYTLKNDSAVTKALNNNELWEPQLLQFLIYNYGVGNFEVSVLPIKFALHYEQANTYSSSSYLPGRVSRCCCLCQKIVRAYLGKPFLLV